MFGVSHWGMFEAKFIPYRLWPLTWAGHVDCQFEESIEDAEGFAKRYLGHGVPLLRH